MNVYNIRYTEKWKEKKRPKNESLWNKIYRGNKKNETKQNKMYVYKLIYFEKGKRI